MRPIHTTRETGPVTRDSVRESASSRHSPTSALAARSAAGLLGVVAAFHVAIAVGAPWGEYTQGGGTTGTLAASGRITAAVSSLVTLVVAGAILARVRQGPLRRVPTRAGTALSWFALLYAVVGVVMNLITRSEVERNLWAPVSIVLLALIAHVIVTTRHSRAAKGEPPDGSD